MDTLFQWLRQLMFFIDNIVYSLIGNIYELIIYLANLDLVTDNSVLHELVSRIYLLLGIFMLFKVAFSMIQYLIDPNSFSDSSKGFGKLVTNTLISIVLLVSVPFIFEKAYEFQGLVLESNAINRLILGDGESYVNLHKIDDDDVENTMATNIRQMAVDVQFTLFSAFYTLNTSDDSSGIPDCAPDNSEYKNSNVIGSADMVLNEGCFEAFAEESAQEMKSYGAQLTDFFKTADSSGKTITDNRKFDSFGKLLWWKIGGSGSSFTINYTPIISTIVGAYLVFLLLAYAIDIAARAIKLMFLQMIAPIAIVSYIDPKESISNGKLNNWIKESLSTYVSLFLRLAIIFLAIRLVAMLTSMLFYPVDLAMDALTGSNNASNKINFYNDLEPQGTMNMFIYVFLVLGIFSFAKEFPKMIEKIFGISGSGNLHLNPLKALGENAGVRGLFGATVGGAASSIASGATALAQGKNPLGAIKSAFAGGVAGTVRGTKGGVKGQNLGGAWKAGLHSGGISARNKQMKGELGIDYFKDPFGSAKKSLIKGVSRVSDKVGGPTPGQILKGRAGRYDRVVDAGQTYKKMIAENSAKSNATYGNSTFKQESSTIQHEIDRMNKKWENGGYASVEAYQLDLDRQKRKQDTLQEEYRKQVLSGKIADYEVSNAQKAYDDALTSVYGRGTFDPNSDGYVSGGINQAKGSSAKSKGTDTYRTAVQVGDTIENLNKERFYETSGRGGGS